MEKKTKEKKEHYITNIKHTLSSAKQVEVEIKKLAMGAMFDDIKNNKASVETKIILAIQAILEINTCILYHLAKINDLDLNTGYHIPDSSSKELLTELRDMIATSKGIKEEL